MARLPGTKAILERDRRGHEEGPTTLVALSYNADEQKQEN